MKNSCKGGWGYRQGSTTSAQQKLLLNTLAFEVNCSSFSGSTESEIGNADRLKTIICKFRNMREKF